MKAQIEDRAEYIDEKYGKRCKIRENLEALFLAILLALFIRTFVIQAFKIPSGSMKETLKIGDHILVNKFIFGVKLPFFNVTIIPVKNPSRGDITVFKFPRNPEQDFIKRVVGIAGDTIMVRDKKLYVNGKLTEYKAAINTDPRLIISGENARRDNFGPVTVPKNCLFVMGDNRDHSYDSRFWGFVNLKAVKGKAFIIYWSWNSDGEGLQRVRWSRIGTLLK